VTPLLEHAVAAAGATSSQPAPFNDIKRKTLHLIITKTRNHCYANSVGRLDLSISWRRPSPPASPPYNLPISSSLPASPSLTPALTTSHASPKSYKQRAYVLDLLDPTTLRPNPTVNMPLTKPHYSISSSSPNPPSNPPNAPSSTH